MPSKPMAVVPTKQEVIRNFIETAPDAAQKTMLGDMPIKLPAIGAFGLITYACSPEDIEAEVGEMMKDK